MKTEAWRHCSSWWKKLRWSGSISFVSRCIHFVFFPHTHFAALSQTAYQKLDTPVTNWAAIKGRKRKALLSAADWDPRLPSYLKDVSLCVCVCMFGAQPAADKESWHNHLISHFPASLQVFPQLTFQWVLNRQNQIDAAVSPALTHARTLNDACSLHTKLWLFSLE